MTQSTTVMGTQATPARVRSYVAQVRAELADLPAEEVEEITMGMEADLAELAAESGADLRIRLGTPQTYAAELRAAAGLPSRVSRDQAGLGWWARGRAGALREAATRTGAQLVSGAPWLRELRGAWWVARGAAVGAYLALMFATIPATAKVLLGILVIGASIMLGLRTASGRGRWRPVALLNVTLAFLALGLGLRALTGDFTRAPEVATISKVPAEGLYNGGALVGNLYAYDAQGRRIESVRLFDQRGHQVVINGTEAEESVGGSGDSTTTATFYDENGESRTVDSFPAAWIGPAWGPILGWTPPVSIIPATSSPAESSPTASSPANSTPTAPTSDGQTDGGSASSTSAPTSSSNSKTSRASSGTPSRSSSSSTDASTDAAPTSTSTK